MAPSRHVRLEPLERRLRPALKFEVAIPARGSTPNPVELLVGDRDVDVFRPFLWGPGSESDARPQDESWFQVRDAISRYSGEGQSPRDDDFHRDRLRPDQASHTAEGLTP
jgi:hypothetical protein